MKTLSLSLSLLLPTLLGRTDARKEHAYLYWESPGYGGQLPVRFGELSPLQTIDGARRKKVNP